MMTEFAFYFLCFLLGFAGFGFYLRAKRIRQQRELLKLLEIWQKHQVDELYGRTPETDEKEDSR